MPKLFISYRRDDSQWPTDMLYRSLKAHVDDPRRDIFIDVDNIPLGINFAQHLDDKVQQCDVLLAVIGSGWLTARSADGKRRLDDPADFVRIEIAAALKRGIPVVPVLLDGTRVPAANELPDVLRELSFRNGVEVRRNSFEADVARLTAGLNLPRKRSARHVMAASSSIKRTSMPGWPVSIIILLGLAAVAIAVIAVDPFKWRSRSESPPTVAGATPLTESSEYESAAHSPEEDAWLRSKAVDTYESYRAFLKQYPSGSHTAEARGLQAEKVPR